MRLLLAAALLTQVSVPPAQPGSQAPPVTSPPATGTAAISGTIIDAATNQPVSGAIVSLERIDDRAWTGRRVLTDSRGRFVFLSLPAGADYYLGARRFGYEPTRYGWSKPDGPLATELVRRVALTDGQWVDTIQIPLWKLGAISGRVTDERDEPVVGVVVRAFSMVMLAGRSQWIAGPMATTDDRGVYQITGLNPGRYAVSVLSVQSTVLATTPEAAQARPLGELESGGFMAGRGNAVKGPAIDVDGRHRLAITNFATPPPPASGRARAYPAVFYPNARTLGESAPIEIGYGKNQEAIDFHLEPVPSVRLSGQATGTAAPFPPLLLRLLPAGSERLGFGSEAATSPLLPDGSFTFLNVPEGRYTLVAQASVMEFSTGSPILWLDDAPGFPAGSVGIGSHPGAPGLTFHRRFGAPAAVWGRVGVSVGGADVDNVELRLQPTRKISGRIVLDAGTEVPSSQTTIFVSARPADSDPTLGEHRGSAPATDPALAFTIEGLLPGTYLLRPSVFPAMSVMWQGKDFADTGFDMSQGVDFEDVVITVTAKQTEVTGAVRDRAGPAPAAVIAFPVDRERWLNYSWEPRLFRTTQAGSTGAYRLRQLPEGEYYLIAVDTARVDAWTDPKFLAAAVPLASRVSITWGDKKVQDLTVANVVVK